jgi:hypothetical protein
VYGKYEANHIPLKELYKNLKTKVVVDEETGLMYGFGYDDFIQLMKAENRKKVVDFGDDINSIYTKLGFMQKDDLVFLHRYIIAQATKGNFRDQAKALILDAIVAEILAQKHVGPKNRKKIESLLGEEHWKEVKQVIDLKDTDKAIEKAKALNIPEKTLDSLALYLAKERVKDNLISKSKGRNL